jgi:hypothetical protein
VLDDFAGKFGLVWRQTDLAHIELICHLLEDEGQCWLQVRVVAFNTAESWSLDVTNDIAAELVRACANRREIPQSIVDFIADQRRPTAPQHQPSEYDCIK